MFGIKVIQLYTHQPTYTPTTTKAHAVAPLPNLSGRQ